MRNPSTSSIVDFKLALFSLFMLPFARLCLDAMTERLGPDPVADILHTTGDWSLRLLLLSLAVTPLRQATGWNWLVKLRRLVSLYAFFYASLHVLAYLVFEQAFDWPEIAKDITKRPYLTAGFAAFVLMAPLAATSTHGMMRRLGGRNWQKLHRLAYFVAIAAVFHYFWLVKRDTTWPALYALALAVLLCVRLSARPRKTALAAPRPPRGLAV